MNIYKKFISFGSIEQFRSIIRDISHTARYQGKDENDEPIFDNSIDLPIVSATGTEKIHGTNAAVCFNSLDGFWIQSRKNIITIEKDNAGCAFAVTANEEAWMKIIQDLATEHNIDLDKNTICVFFEWAGGNIQKKSAFSGLDKRAMIFEHFKVVPHSGNDEEVSYWLPTWADVDFGVPYPDITWASDAYKNIFNVMDFPKQYIHIDFNRPDLAANTMIEMIEKNEMSSPVGKAFRIEDNILEGYVFTFTFKRQVYKFKVKGEEHAKGSGKVKTLKPVDSVLEQKKINFVNNNSINNSRLEQAWQNTFGIDGEYAEKSMKECGAFIRFVLADVWKEEVDIAVELGIEPKTVNGMISKQASKWFKSKLASGE